jgi:hypothetical protein
MSTERNSEAKPIQQYH